MAQGAAVGAGGVDILGEGIFESGDFVLRPDADTNFDSVVVGNDRARAIGVGAQFPGPFAEASHAVAAQNNLKIKKNQDSGACECCQALNPACPCQDCCEKYNVEQIKVGSRDALAIGASFQGPWPFAGTGASVLAQNNVEIVTNQQ
jgi:hypothetical protein